MTSSPHRDPTTRIEQQPHAHAGSTSNIRMTLFPGSPLTLAPPSARGARKVIHAAHPAVGLRTSLRADVAWIAHLGAGGLVLGTPLSLSSSELDRSTQFGRVQDFCALRGSARRDRTASARSVERPDNATARDLAVARHTSGPDRRTGRPRASAPRARGRSDGESL